MIGGVRMFEVFVATDFRRRDARDKLRGRTRYTIDRYLPGMLHATVLRASVPSGRIVRLDVSRAARMPGVRAVVTAADAPGKIGIGIADHPLLARDLICYDGEPLAAIAADTSIQAKAALGAINVEVEPLPAVLTMAEALAPEAPLVHPDWREHDGGSDAVQLRANPERANDRKSERIRDGRGLRTQALTWSKKRRDTASALCYDRA